MTFRPTSFLSQSNARPGEEQVIAPRDTSFAAGHDYKDGRDKDDEALSLATMIYASGVNLFGTTPKEDAPVTAEQNYIIYENPETGEIVRLTEAQNEDPAYVKSLTDGGFRTMFDAPVSTRGGHDHGLHDDGGPAGEINYRHDGGGLTLNRPVGNVQTDSFKTRERHPVHGGHAAHRGVDLGTPAGTAVRASADGVVAYSGWSNGYGNVVIVYHGDGVFTMQAHLTGGTAPRAGTEVHAGDVIAKSGASGIGTGAHLHTEVWLADAQGRVHSVDPNAVWRGADLSDVTTRNTLIANAERTLHNREEATAYSRAAGSVSAATLRRDVQALTLDMA